MLVNQAPASNASPEAVTELVLVLADCMLRGTSSRTDFSRASVCTHIICVCVVAEGTADFLL